MISIKNYSLGFTLILMLFFTSCKKEGCTSECATNYDSKAKKDDGSCRGCKNSKAVNYCSDAKIADNNICSCNGYGYLNVSNKSNTTVQKILIGGTNYGTLDPGESKEIRLAAGKHTLAFQALSGGGGCNPSEVLITECGSEYIFCSF